MDLAGFDGGAHAVVGADIGDGGAGRAACGAPEEVGVAERARRVALVGGVGGLECDVGGFAPCVPLRSRGRAPCDKQGDAPMIPPFAETPPLPLPAARSPDGRAR